MNTRAPQQAPQRHSPARAHAGEYAHTAPNMETNMKANKKTNERANAKEARMTQHELGSARRTIRHAREGAGDVYLAAGAYATATLTSLASAGGAAGSANDSAGSPGAGSGAAGTTRARMLVVAAFFCAVSVLALVLPQSIAHAQGGGGGGFNPEQGADEIWQVIGIVGMLVGAIVGIGAIFTRRVLAGLGFLLAGGIIWVVSQDPEGTVGAAAEWIMDAF